MTLVRERGLERLVLGVLAGFALVPLVLLVADPAALLPGIGLEALIITALLLTLAAYRTKPRSIDLLDDGLVVRFAHRPPVAVKRAEVARLETSSIGAMRSLVLTGPDGRVVLRLPDDAYRRPADAGRPSARGLAASWIAGWLQEPSAG
ncbi:MAG: hypothetical protein WCK58_14575 [Chloroflexota bacterium]